MPPSDTYDPDDDIPSIDYRIRAIFNDEPPPRMREHLQEFLEVTGLDNHGDLFTRAMYIAQHNEALNRDTDGNDKEPELEYASQHPDDFSADDPPRTLCISDQERFILKLDASPGRAPSARRRWRFPRFEMPDPLKWHALPAGVKHIVLVCGIGATVQGIDQAVVNGAQALYLAAFDIQIATDRSKLLHDNPGKAGLINAAPYLCCVVSCWFTPWLNRFLGRRGTIFVCALFSIFFAFAQAFARTWQELVVFRLLMGLGIGPKSATIPIYAAETAPANIRGSLVTCWQAFTALGIAIGCAFSIILQQFGDMHRPGKCQLPDGDDDPQKAARLSDLLSLHCSWNWRIILASPMILPILLALLIYFCRESPRWTVSKAHNLYRRGQPHRAQYYYRQAFRDLQVLSRSPILAAREMFIHFFYLRKEYEEAQKARDNPYRTWVGHKLRQLFGKHSRRNQRAITASTICMIAQQLCGVNLLIYYSNYVLGRRFKDGEDGNHNQDPDVFNQSALLHTMGFGITNFLLALPAFLLIDIMGRRTLLLSTFPFLSFSHLIMALSAALKTEANQRAMFLAGFYLFCIFYSPGEGPVPFVYASESMPLSIRTEGMGLVTSINWFFNWLVAFSAPFLFDHLHMGGTFSLYAALCAFLWVLIFLFVPETRLLTLEQLDYVFNEVETNEFARHAIRNFKYHSFMTSTYPGSIYDEKNRSARRSTNLEAGLSNIDSNKVTNGHYEMVATHEPRSRRMHLPNSSGETMT